MTSNKILIIRFSSIGDIVLTTPVIRNLKKQLQGAEIHYCTKKQYSSILEANPYLDKIHYLEDSLNDLVAKLKKENFTYIVDLHHNLRTWILKTRLGIKSSSFKKLNLDKWLLVNLKINRMPSNIHLVDRYMETINSLGVTNDLQGLDYFIPDKDEVEDDWLPKEFQKGYVVFAIGGKFNTKKLPLPKMIHLCDMINRPVILLGGKEDQTTGDEIEKFFRKNQPHPVEEKLFEMNKKTLVFNGCGKFNLNQSASVIKNARYVFTHDTGLMHIAAAFNKEIYSIWGNTTPYFGMYPYKSKFTVFENNRLKCRPCSKIGHSKCPLTHFKCMNDLKFDFYLKW